MGPAFNFGHVKLDVPTSRVKMLSWHLAVSLGFRREVWVGDVHLRIISDWMVLEVMTVSEISEGLSVAREKIKD